MRCLLRASFSACLLIGIAACSATPEWTQAIGWNSKGGDAAAPATPAEASDAAPATPAPGSAAAPAWLPGIAPAAGEPPRGDADQPHDAETVAASSDAADQGVWSPKPAGVVRAPVDKDTAPAASGPKSVSAIAGRDTSSAILGGGASTSRPQTAAKIRGTFTAALPSGDGAQANATRAAPRPGPGTSSSQAPGSPAGADAFVKRGDQLLQIGDITGARLCYERAVAGGVAAAATKVGMTYDPLYLAEAGVQGLHGDPAEAAQWYRKGISAGDPEALQRLSLLSQTPLR